MIFKNYSLSEHGFLIPFFSVAILIGLMCLQLASCAPAHIRYLTFDASLIKKGDTMARVEKVMGFPDARRINSAGQEEWYYYRVKSHFWQRIPLLGKYLGKKQVDALQVVFQTGIVQRVTYYVPGT